MSEPQERKAQRLPEASTSFTVVFVRVSSDRWNMNLHCRERREVVAVGLPYVEFEAKFNFHSHASHPPALKHV